MKRFLTKRLYTGMEAQFWLWFGFLIGGKYWFAAFVILLVLLTYGVIEGYHNKKAV